MEKITFQVAQYDAPLDLILHLISRHKLNITDIDISSLLEQYISTIQLWEKTDLEVSSEFLEMASRLVYIKTVSLLPRHEEETEHLRQELSGQLIEYRLCKIAAKRLGDISLHGQVFVRAPAPFEIDQTYTLTHPPGILYAALADALGRGARRLPPPPETFAPLVTRPVVSVTGKIFTLLRRLRKGGKLRPETLFESAQNRSGIVATFLALLELVKSGKVCVDDETIHLSGKN